MKSIVLLAIYFISMPVFADCNILFRKSVVDQLLSRKRMGPTYARAFRNGGRVSMGGGSGRNSSTSEEAPAKKERKLNDEELSSFFKSLASKDYTLTKQLTEGGYTYWVYEDKMGKVRFAPKALEFMANLVYKIRNEIEFSDEIVKSWLITTVRVFRFAHTQTDKIMPDSIDSRYIWQTIATATVMPTPNHTVLSLLLSKARWGLVSHKFTPKEDTSMMLLHASYAVVGEEKIRLLYSNFMTQLVATLDNPTLDDVYYTPISEDGRYDSAVLKVDKRLVSNILKYFAESSEKLKTHARNWVLGKETRYDKELLPAIAVTYFMYRDTNLRVEVYDKAFIKNDNELSSAAQNIFNKLYFKGYDLDSARYALQIWFSLAAVL